MKKILLLFSALALSLQAQAPATVTVTPTTLPAFTYQIGAAPLPAAQTITVKASSGTPAFTAAVTPSNIPWLTVSPSSGTLPATLNVRVNPTSLPAATYSNAAISITVNGAITTVPVTLIVTPAPSTLSLSTSTLNFTAPPFPPANQTVTLSTNGAPISFTITSGAPWLTALTPLGGTSGIVFQGAEYPLTIAVDPISLTPQTAPYVGKITIATSGAATTAKSLSLTVNLTVSTLTPTISSVWPSTLPVNGPAQTITIQGKNFYGTSVAKIKGVTVPLATTTFKDSSTILQAAVPASLLTSATTLKLLVSNLPPGGDSATIDINVANSPSLAAVVNAASFAPGPAAGGDLGTVSPGELVTLFGSNIGPTSPAPMAITNGVVDTTLSGVTVTVDGKPAPLIYAGQDQLSIQVPYEASIGTGRKVIVTNGASGSGNATVTIAATAPGLFTADGSGIGPAAAINYSSATKQYSLNTATNLAKIGDIVLLYVTGEGIYDQAPLLGGASDTGFIVPSTPQCRRSLLSP